ncbi:uncharacterized protein LOC125677422 [Ostrea edulis]|uniref:uncharacterized protein LOC125677422 n=1 Tax=Ostrea edulis TaxID=37623 RepID=UPI0024AF42E5|nr:uncharacterized protein LOC125677422 [Ostrea edulis]
MFRCVSSLAFLCLLQCLGIFTTSPTSPATTTTTRRHNHHHTRHPHTTREPFEKAQAVFQYDHYSHIMVYKDERATCYVYAVHPDDRHLVHTESGLFSLEVEVMKLALNASEPYLHDDLEVRSKKLSLLCPRSFTLISLN